MDKAVPLLFDLGIFISRNVLLMTKVLRICHVILELSNESAEGDVMRAKVRVRVGMCTVSGRSSCPHFTAPHPSLPFSPFHLTQVESLLTNVLLPALLLVKSHAALCNELWEVLKLLPYETRYRIYGYWKVGGEEAEGRARARARASERGTFRDKLMAQRGTPFTSSCPLTLSAHCSVRTRRRRSIRR